MRARAARAHAYATTNNILYNKIFSQNFLHNFAYTQDVYKIKISNDLQFQHPDHCVHL
jgi:hypothetical protein